MTNDVFISYSREDGNTAEAIEHYLQTIGLICYRDVNNIPGSAKWIEEITEAIETCHAVVVILSDKSAASAHVDRELSVAVEEKKLFVPILLSEKVRLSRTMRFVLTGHQRIGIGSSVEASLPSIGDAVLRAVDRSKYRTAYDNAANVSAEGNYAKDISFAEDRCGLYVGDSDSGTSSIEGEAYVMSAKPQEYLGFGISAVPKLAEFVLEARIRKLAGPDDHWFGLEFGDRYPGNYYQFLLSGNGSVRLSKHHDRKWQDLASNAGLRHVKPGDVENLFKVVRRKAAIHVFVNGLHALSARDSDVREGSMGLVVGQGIRAAFTNIRIKGLSLAALYEKAMEHWQRFEAVEARQILRLIHEYDPVYVHPNWGPNVTELLAEVRWDYRSTVLIVVGHGAAPMLNDGMPAALLKSEIDRRGDPEKSQFACILTDANISEDPRLEQFALISVGGPIGNKITESFMKMLPQDSRSTNSVNIQHDIDGRDARIALWGLYVMHTAQAVDLFINSGLLGRFLEMIWLRETGDSR
jgi:hypothetical protein